MGQDSHPVQNDLACATVEKQTPPRLSSMDAAERHPAASTRSGEAAMIGRREWLRSTLGPLIAAGAGATSRMVLGQVTSAEKKSKSSRYTVKKPSLSKSKDSPRGTPDPGPVSVRADERLNRRLSSIRDSHQLPGLIGAIVRGEALAAIGAAGVRKLGSDEPIEVTDQVHLGSCTKAMTATLDRHARRRGPALLVEHDPIGVPRAGLADPSRLPGDHPFSSVDAPRGTAPRRLAGGGFPAARPPTSAGPRSWN